MESVKFRPFRDHVLVKPESRIKSSIIEVVTTRSDQDQEGALGKVVAVGPGKINDKGKLEPMELKTGDQVIYGGKGLGCIHFPEYIENGNRYLILQEADCMLIEQEQ